MELQNSGNYAEYEEQIHNLIIDYLNKSENITNHKEKEELLLETIALILTTSNKYVKNREYNKVGNILFNAAYYLEEFNFKDAQQLYLKAIEFYDKYLHELELNGRLDEAAQMCYRIYEIYENKIYDKEKSKKYILKTIEHKKSIININKGLEDPRKIAVIYLTLSDLYMKIADWDNAYAANINVLEISKPNNYYDLTSSAYFNISDIMKFQDNEERAFSFLNDALTYFLEQEKILKQEKRYYFLSQIYQILKNIYAELNNHDNYKLYSQKEAMAYIQLAKKNLEIGNNLASIANFYRGAGDCFRETPQYLLESATCFLISANLYSAIKDYSRSAECYTQAAELYEFIKNFNMSIKMYYKAAIRYTYLNQFDAAIEALIYAYDIIERNQLLSYKNKFIDLIIKYLQYFSDHLAKLQDNFIAGTLLLESIKYYKKKGYSFNSPEIEDLLHRILKLYKKEFENHKDQIRNSSVLYILTLLIITTIALKRFKDARHLINEYDKFLNNNSHNFCGYRIIVEEILECFKNGTQLDISKFDKRVKKLYSNAEEIKIFVDCMFF
ncbi:MAG: hypothetical protein ACTSXF_11720 [Promethearchaeota archaeon]